MYFLHTPLAAVKGIGPKLATQLTDRQLFTVKDLLLYVPLRYEDRSQFVTIRQLRESHSNELVTFQAEVITSGNYYKGRRSIQSATVADETGKLKLMWFNNKFVIDKLVKGKTFLFSGKLNDRGMVVQAVVEDLKDDTIHTGRLVPVYSILSGIKQGTLRRILKHILDQVTFDADAISELHSEFLTLHTSLSQLHFPDQADLVIKARERLALEELLALIKKSHSLKETWAHTKTAITIPAVSLEAIIPQTIPFELTSAQIKVSQEILQDLTQSIPMNRLLIGDVGSGKTVVAGLAAQEVLKTGHHAALIAPTRILAQQHFQTLQQLFPTVPIELVVSGGSKKVDIPETPTLFIGTHAVINRMEKIKPALVVYDEQHRFGVGHRSAALDAQNQFDYFPHVLTMTATPIPRSLMLTIFSHLQLSVIDELPKGRKPVKTWLVPEKKRADAYTWIKQEVIGAQALILCPFIDPSNAQALENVAAVTERYESIRQAFPKYSVGLLHGRLSKTEQNQVTESLFNLDIQILVTTPIVEVGVDLPAANIIVIEGAERFGLASLHQLRGRVGRAGQQAYCLLFTTKPGAESSQRLQKFSETNNGLDLAELDLQRRGAGDLFGTQQHGFEDLKFATWANVELISQAREIFNQLHVQADWKPFLFSQPEATKTTPLAN